MPMPARSIARLPVISRLPEFSASTRATQVRASGTLSSSAVLNLSVTTSDLSEWQPILSDIGYQQRIPVVLQGHASFKGTASGKISAIAFAGKVQSEDFDLLIPATARAPEKSVHCDSMAAQVQLSPQSSRSIMAGCIMAGPPLPST